MILAMQVICKDGGCCFLFRHMQETCMLLQLSHPVLAKPGTAEENFPDKS